MLPFPRRESVYLAHGRDAEEEKAAPLLPLPDKRPQTSGFITQP